MGDEYRVVIGAKLNGRLCYFDLDTCTSKSLSSTATVAQYPVEQGDTVADHMWRNARTLNLSGSFSLAGRNSYEGNNLYTKDNIIGNLAGGEKTWEKWFEEDADELKDLSGLNRLEAIQRVFEYIQAKGILCTVMMCSGRPGDANTRFKIRNNMALSSIQWREMYNSMSYEFGFTEIISVTKLSEFETFDYDGLYPSTYLPATKSLGKMISDSGSLVKIVLEALFDWGYIDFADGKAFSLKGATEKSYQAIWKTCKEIVKQNDIVGTGIGVGAGVLTGAVIGLVVGGPVGAIVGGIIGAIVGGAAGFGISRIVSTVQLDKKNQKLSKGFNLIRNYANYVDPRTLEPIGNIGSAMVNEADMARLRQLLEDVQYAIETQMNNIGIYTITDDDTDVESRDVPLQVGVDALTIRINRNGDGYKIQLLKGYGDDAETVTPLFGGWPVIDSLYTASATSNIIYKDSSRQYELYLYNPYVSGEVAQACGVSNPTALSNHYFVVSHGNIQDNMNKLSKIVTSALANQGYTE